MKIAVVSSYTVDLIIDVVKRYVADRSMECEWYIAPFNQYHQEIRDPKSALCQFKPDVIIILIEGEVFLEEADDILHMLAFACEHYTDATILVHNAVLLKLEPLKFINWNIENSLSERISKINMALSCFVRSRRNMRILDFQGLILQYGTAQCLDSRLYYIAKTPFSSFGLQQVGEQIGVAVSIIAGRRMKCLVLDLDNVLWGGILGEVGMKRILLSTDGPGRAFYDFQQAILKLYRSGIILSICSKNDEKIALDAIERHPYMLLRKDKFAAIRINWSNKAENIVSIAEELNIGLDSFVFLDDSQHEKECVRRLLPTVFTPDMPSDYSHYLQFIVNLSCFETFSITTEDINRGNSYYQERQRIEAKTGSISLEDYFSTLHTQIRLETANAFSFPRVAQLTQRTNQFNLTTRRYTEAQIQKMSQDSSWYLLSVSASDKYGDAGIVGVAFIRFNNNIAYLDTFLLSCRVLGRQIEEAFLYAVLRLSRQRGAKEMIAEYLPTQKNGVAKNFLTNNLFIAQGNLFHFDFKQQINEPKWVSIEYADKSDSTL